MSENREGKIILQGLPRGKDLLKEITRVVRNNNIEKGIIQVIGAVKKAKIGFYEQQNQEYLYTEFNQHLEIISCIGNISILEGKPMVHAHISLADREGNTFGGHLAEGTEIFASELYVKEIKGNKLVRTYKQDTGLSLW